MLEGEGDIGVDKASGTGDEDEEARGGNLGDEGRGQRVIGRQRRGVEVWVRHEKKMTEREEMSRSGLESKYNRMSVSRFKKKEQHWFFYKKKKNHC